MTVPGNYPAIQSAGLAVIPQDHQTLLSAGFRERHIGSFIGSLSGKAVFAAWPYRGSILITNPVTQTNYQHTLTLPWVPGMRPDFADIRFAQLDGTTCPHLIESYTAFISAKVWIKIPSANQLQIYLYFGNSGATSSSSGSDTFDLFDDFTGSSGSSPNSSLWTVSKNGSASAIVQLDGSGNLQLAGAAGASSSGSVISKSTFAKPFILECYEKVDHASYAYHTTSFGNVATPQGEDGGSQWWLTSLQNSYTFCGMALAADAIQRNPSGLGHFTIATFSTDLYGAANTWRTHSYIHNGTQLTAKRDGTTICSPVTDSNYGGPFYVMLAQGEYSGANYGDNRIIAWVRIRKYASTEPTLSLNQYGPRPDAVAIYYPFIPTPHGIIGLKYEESLDFSQTVVGDNPTVVLASILSSNSIVTPGIPITHSTTTIPVSVTQVVKISSRMYLDFSAVRLEKVRITKSIQDTLWKATFDLHEYKDLDTAILRHCIYATTDYLGISHTRFTGILPGSGPKLAPADESTQITGYDYGWYLTQRQVPATYLHNTATPNPSTVILGLLGDDDWLTETGIEPYCIQAVAAWGSTLNTRVFDFERTTSRWQAIQKICDYTRHLFVVKWRDNSGIITPCAYFCHEDDIDTFLDLPDPVTFTKPTKWVLEPITWDVKGEERYNRVTVFGRSSTGVSISYTAETDDVTNGDEIPIEFVESSGAFTTTTQVQARAEELLEYFGLTAITYTVKLIDRVDLELLQQVKFSGWTEISDEWMRIIAIEYDIQNEADKTVTIQVTPATKFSQIRRMYRSMNPDPTSEMEALFDAKAASMPGNAVGTVTAISEDGLTATVTLEDGRVVTARIV